jgi:DNA polymerase I-like protein with 3'-5' exonuclease and polymerase domains
MRIIAFDTETHLIRPGCPVPKMVCLSWAEYRDVGEPPDLSIKTPERLEHDEDPWVPKGAPEVTVPWLRVGLRNARGGLKAIRSWLTDPEVTIVGHNTRFDLAVCAVEDPELLPLIFQAYEENRILDTMVRQQLCDIAQGFLKMYIDEETDEFKHTEYGLDKLAYRLCKRYLVKKDTWRLKYALLDGVPLTEWPEEAVRYALLDAIVTLDIHRKQEELAGGPIPNSAEQHKADWALYLMSLWGVRTDPAAVEDLRQHLEKEYTEQMTALRPSGLLRITPPRTKRTGEQVPEQVTRDMKTIRARVESSYEAKGLQVPKTDNQDNPQTSTDRKTLKNSGDKDLCTLAEAGKTAKLLQTYVPILESGTRFPINCRYNVLVDTGRTSCSGPNLQNPPR